MTRPRSQLVSVTDTPYYHVTSRCVRRAFLCGVDPATQISYEHRRQWIVERIRLLSSLFAIDICAYAVMSNHYHIVIKLAPEQSERWTDEDVVQRWKTLFKGPLLIQRLQRGQPISPAERSTIDDIIAEWRRRLRDLSWFMKCLNEPIARAANQEDNCKGHFWEARYTSQALLTEQALLSCMAYVDLNPIRANMARTPETSDFTSIKERIIRHTHSTTDDRKSCLNKRPEKHTTKPLLHFDGDASIAHQDGIPFAEQDYLILVDLTGRVIRDDKRGHIPIALPSILTRLNINTADWLKNTKQFEQRFQRHFNHRKKKTA